MIKLNPINNIINLKLSTCLNRVAAKVFDRYAREIAKYQEQVCGDPFVVQMDNLELLVTVLGSSKNRFDFQPIVNRYGLDLDSCLDSYDVMKLYFSCGHLKQVLSECLTFISDYLKTVGTLEQYLDFCNRLNRMIDGSYFGVDARNTNEGRVFEVIRFIIGYTFILQYYHERYTNDCGRLDCADYQISVNARDGAYYYQPALYEAEQDARILLVR